MNKRHQTRKSTYCVTPFMWNPKAGKILKEKGPVIVWDSKFREAGPKTEMRELSGAMQMCYILIVASYMNAFIC